MEGYVYKCFETPKFKYIYVRDINSILRLPKNDYNSLLNTESDMDEIFKRYVAKGIFIKNQIKNIEHPANELLRYHLGNKCQMLTLQVTQQCNLRCEYCAYSGMYKNRAHSNKHMTFDTAKKAIDFFITHSRDTEELSFGFYGGEPLLEMLLIKRCITYIQSAIEGKKVSYSITTNGTLLSDEIVDYFVKQDIMLSVSLDGSKKEHDMHRKFKSGKGSFDTVMNNIKRLKDRYPEYAKRISFMPVVTPNSDLTKTIKYFMTDDIVKDSRVSFNRVNEIGKEEELEKKQGYNAIDFELVYEYEYLKVIFLMAGMLSKEDITPLTSLMEGEFLKVYHKINSHDIMPSITHHGGPCIPGAARLFVSTDGLFYPCEKVSEANQLYSIGNIESGFDLKKVEEMLNLGKITESECKECWCLPHCSICIASIEIGDGISKENKICACEREKRKILDLIYDIAVISEFKFIQKWGEINNEEISSVSVDV